MEKTAGRAFYDRQIALLEARDIAGVAAQQYAADAVIVSFDFTVRGREAIQRHFEGYLERLGYIKLVSTDKFTEIDDAIYFEATIEVAAGEAHVYDVFILRDGQAIRHFTGLTSFTPR